MADGIFVCDCGTRLRIFTEGNDRDEVPCPDPSCKTRHIVSGQVREVQLDRNDTWLSYDWKAHQRI